MRRQDETGEKYLDRCLHTSLSELDGQDLAFIVTAVICGVLTLDHLFPERFRRKDLP